MTWVCTSEKALQARPAEVLEVATAFGTNDTETDDAAQAMIDLGVAGWRGFSGEMEIGFGNLVEAVGKSMKSVSMAAGEAGDACTTASNTLGDLETESDALLIVAEEQLVELEALLVEAGEWDTKKYWRNQAVIQTGRDRIEDPAAYDTAVRRLHDADVALYWIHTAAEMKRGELTASQVTFDRIREDEETAQSDLATALSPIYDTLGNAELEFSADDLVGVDIVLDIFDLAYLSITVGSKEDAAGRGALLDARNALAALLGIDTTERDQRFVADEARRELERLGPEGYAAALRTAVADGDIDEMRRLAELLANGIDGLSPEDAQKLRDEIEAIGEDLDTFARGFRHFFLFFLGIEAPVPEWILDIVLNAEGGIGYFGLGDAAARDELARQFGLDPLDPEIGDKLLTKLYERIIAERGFEFLADQLGAGNENPVASAVVLAHLEKNPNLIVDLAFSNEADDIQSLQLFLDMADRELGDDEFEAFITALATGIADPQFTTPDGNYSDPLGNDMAGNARAIGRLLYEASRANESASFDAGPILRLLAGTAVSAAGTAAGGPAAGQGASLALSSILAMWDGSAASTREGDTIFEADTYEQQSILAVAAIAAAGGPAAERLGELAQEYPDPEAFLEHLENARSNADARRSGDENQGQHPDNDIAQYVDEFVNEMNSRIVDVSSNDG